jgi:hypothetical protein
VSQTVSDVEIDVGHLIAHSRQQNDDPSGNRGAGRLYGFGKDDQRFLQVKPAGHFCVCRIGLPLKWNRQCLPENATIKEIFWRICDDKTPDGIVTNGTDTTEIIRSRNRRIRPAFY